MMRLIDADALKTKLCTECTNGVIDTTCDYSSDGCGIIEIINKQPTIEAEPVRHGRWIELPHALNPSEHPHKCSVCEHVLSFYGAYPKADYCPHCGADMREGGAEDA